ncbi:uncharacterized protein LOC124662360 [Lolium rigidum]|uniref:uncharacterized protein LOC124662360 n=1 Tax=Lolium rigidum TaxID=89674 RepID=UPI001F5C4851|nr:uncharacterized protein LOC124662360 [Lolium rigidum]
MEGHGRTAAAASVAAVLGDDDLLLEILLLLGFPNYLVRAALVSKRWLLHASEPAFLSSFSDRHPPRLLGFCIDYPGRCQLVQLPQTPELAAISRRAATSCADVFARRHHNITHCRNGRLITKFFEDDRFRYSILSPLLEESESVLPPTPLPHNGRDGGHRCISLPEDGGQDGITLLRLWRDGRKASVEVCVLGAGGWGAPTTAETEIQPPYPEPYFEYMSPPIHGKIFMATTVGYTLGLDLATSRFFILEHPDGVGGNFKLSCADSDLYLVSARWFQLSVWLHKVTGDDDGSGGWLLVDAFCVQEECTRVVCSRRVCAGGDFVNVAAVGDNAEFVFLNHPASANVIYVHLRSRLVELAVQFDFDARKDFSLVYLEYDAYLACVDEKIKKRNVISSSQG